MGLVDGIRDVSDSSGMVGCVRDWLDVFRNVSRINRFSLGPIEGGSKGGVTVLEGSKVLARGTRSCT